MAEVAGHCMLRAKLTYPDSEPESLGSPVSYAAAHVLLSAGLVAYVIWRSGRSLVGTIGPRRMRRQKIAESGREVFGLTLAFLPIVKEVLDARMNLRSVL
jgi:hypothetical protein